MGKSKYTSSKYWIDEWIKPLIIAVILALFIRTFIMQPFKIPSSSMLPTLQVGDRIFVNKFIYGAKIPFTDFRLPKVRDPQLGDIVVFLSPDEPKKFLVKRFIAEGPQTVEIADGYVLVDGRVMEFANLEIKYLNRGKYGKTGQAMKIPKGTFYVLGDNSENSIDSRYWGVVPAKNLVGKAFIIHWPIPRIGLIK